MSATLEKRILLALFMFIAGNVMVIPCHAYAAIPTYNGSGTFTSGIGSITPPYPAGMLANDVCLLVVTSENQAITLTTANGFAELTSWSPQSAGTAATNPGSRLAVYWKRTTGGDSAPVVADSGNNTEGVIHCFSGVTTSGNPWDTGAGGNDSAANDTAGNIPGSTTSMNNDLVVLIESSSFNGTSAAQCSGWTNADLANITEQQDNTSTSGLGGGSCMATGELATAGPYTTTTVTLANTTFKGAISVALMPPVTAPVISTDVPSNVTTFSATFNGSITDTGGSDALDNGFAYGTDPVLATVIATSSLGGFAGTGSFSEDHLELQPSTTYYVRAYATNSTGTGYGSIQPFTTSDTIPARTLRLISGKIKIDQGSRLIINQL